MTIKLKQEKTCRNSFTFYSAEPTQLEDSMCTTRELLVIKHFPIQLFQINRFCKISQFFNTVLLLVTIKIDIISEFPRQGLADP